MSAGLVELLEDVEHVMLDFDGPMCSVFAGDPAPDVAERIRAFAAQHVELPAYLQQTSDPLDFLRLATDDTTQFGRQLGDAVRDGELTAVRSASETPGALDVLAAAERSGRTLSIVSNNAREAVEAYLQDRDLAKYFDTVAARPTADADLMKPNPYLLAEALRAYAARAGRDEESSRRSSVFVGDSMTDIHAAKAAGVPCIAYANKPGKREQFEQSDAVAIITDMHELADALNARWDAQWCSRQGGC